MFRKSVRIAVFLTIGFLAVTGTLGSLLIRSLRVLIAHGAANEICPMEMARQDYLALYGAGVDVTLNTYPTTHKVHPHMWRDANRWLMHNVMVDSAFDAQDDDFDD